MEALLEDQVARGQIVKFPEATAKQMYGKRLTVAALAALEKGEAPDGSTLVRIIHDGTNGVDMMLQ